MIHHSTEAETIVIGSVFLDPSLFILAADAGITTDSFTPGIHARCWEAIEYFDGKGEDLEELLVADYISSKGTKCSFADITAITDKIETTSAFEHSLSRLRELNRLNTLTHSLTAACEAVKQPGYDWAELVDRVQPFVTESEAVLNSSGDADASEDGKAVLRMIDDIMAGKPDPRKFIKSGIADLDEKAKGYASTEMVVIGARPSRGKTALMNQCVVANLMTNKRVVLFSLEMSRQSIIECLASIKSQVNSWTLDRDLYEKQKKFREGVEWVMDHLDKSLFIFDSRTAKTIQQICSRTKAVEQQVNGLDLITADYAQIIMTQGRHNSTIDRISEVSREFKQQIMSSKCTGIMLAQLNRDCEKENRIPRASDLSSCGMLEQDADLLLLNSRPTKNWDAETRGFNGGIDQSQGGLMEYDHLLDIVKRRRGPTGSFPARFVPAVTTFHRVR